MMENGTVTDRMLRLVVRAAVSIGLAGLFVWLLSTRLNGVDAVAVGRAVSGVRDLQWTLALVATAVSFWAVGRYDGVVHRYLESGVAPAVARSAGICAIAVSQMLGLGVITGTVVRLSMLPGQSTAMAARLTVAVALSFLAGWAVVTALVVLALPGAPFKPMAAAVLGFACVAIVASLIWPHRMRQVPNLFTQVRLIGLAAVDTLAAALALYVLLPPDLGLSWLALLPAFLIAQGAGLVSGAPGGIGAFEVTLLALLPDVPQDPLLAAILAWRLTYFALPAVLGGLVAAVGPRPTADAPVRTVPQAILARAETQIEAQGEHCSLPSADWLVGRTPHLLVGLFDPTASDADVLQRLVHAARRTDRWPAIYKCSARTAARARTEGWHVLAVAREAWLDPTRFDLTPARRSALRRKLRQAKASHLRVTPGSALLPLVDMERVAALWASVHGGERGFSMGRYTPDYVRGQQVFLAWCGDRLVGFATFHRGAQEWTLDLMRHLPDAPPGTTHALVTAGIAEAARCGVARLSLASVPEAAFGRALPVDRALARLGCAGAGLLQFKASFAPQWQPLYLAAPHRPALGLAVCEIARAIAMPPPLRQTEQDHAEYGFASAV